MCELSLNKPAGVLVKTTLVDFPGTLAGSFFLTGCNLRCPYCYNVGLIHKSPKDENLNTIQELFDHLEKRQGILKGLTISGGEPLLNPYTPIIIKKAKELGYLIKLDTNGTLCDELEYFLNNAQLRPDFVAMDVKTSLNRYATEIANKNSKFYNNSAIFENKLKKSIQLLSNLPANSREFRTVLVPTLVERQDIKNIAEYLPKNANWEFAQFQNSNCLNPEYNNITPYTDQEITELINYAKSFIPGAELR